MVLKALLGAAVVAAVAGSAARDRVWTLGGGFSTRVHAEHVLDYRATRVLVITRGSVVIRRFRREDEGMGVQVADVTSDHVKDVLVLDYWDGSGACGEYTFFTSPHFRPVWRRRWCADFAIARLFRGGLVSWSAVGSSKTKASGTGIHCCWSRWRRTEWRLRGGKLVPARSVVGPPPPARWRAHLLPGTNA